jgi:hypothetical protein
MVLLLFNGDPKKEPFYGDYAFQRRNAKVYHEGKAKIDIKKFAQLITARRSACRRRFWCI